jgi:hypothetical protein
VDREADIKAKDHDGQTVLHWAALGGNEAVIRLLVDRGADVEAKDDNGKSALHWAASRVYEVALQRVVNRRFEEAYYGVAIVEAVLRITGSIAKEVVLRLRRERSGR